MCDMKKTVSLVYGNEWKFGAGHTVAISCNNSNKIVRFYHIIPTCMWCEEKKVLFIWTWIDWFLITQQDSRLISSVVCKHRTLLEQICILPDLITSIVHNKEILNHDLDRDNVMFQHLYSLHVIKNGFWYFLLSYFSIDLYTKEGCPENLIVVTAVLYQG